MTDVTPTDAGTADGGDLGGPDGPGETMFPEDGGLAAERERLSRDLRETRLQLAMTQTRLSAIEASASWRFGRIVAKAAKNPWGRGTRLPKDLYRLWRERGAHPSTPVQTAVSALASAQLTDLAGSGERFLSALTTPGTPVRIDPALTLSGGAFADAARGPVITGALSALGCATLAPDAVVHPLLPHDADVVIENVGADVVVIEAAALLPGSPWAFATDPAAADRGRRLARMILMARALSMPVLLVRNVPQSLLPGLSWLVPAVDDVLDMDFGVQLARFNPVGVAGDRPVEPVYAGDRDPREAPAVRMLLDALTADGGGDGGRGPAVTLTGARSWRALPALYRSHGVFLTAAGTQRHEQEASGARVVPLGGVRDSAEVRAQLEAARAAGPLPRPEIRAGLRDIFARHSTSVRLTTLARAAGLPDQVVGGRQLAVLARVSDAAGATRLADALQRQRLGPAEVIVAASPAAAGAARDALSDLADKGVRVLVTDGSGGSSGSGSGGSGSGDSGATGEADVDWARPLARHASSGWVAPWPAPGPAGPEHTPPDAYLLDLMCARECAQADAVGLGEAEYEFASSLDAPALVRRDLLTPDGPPVAAWGGHGLRLFTVTR